MDVRFTVDELRFFKRNGFVVKRGVFPPDRIARAVDVFWEKAPAQLQRDDPESWMGPFKEEYHFSDGTDQIDDYRWNLRHIGEEEWLMDLIQRDPNMIGMAEQLLGEGVLDPPGKARGIYTTLPRDPETAPPDRFHVDQNVFHVCTVTYLGKVGPGGGGFRVWPASHLWFSRIFKSEDDEAQTRRYEATQAFLETQPSVECTGDTGDVVFWHHRLAHMAGHNFSRRLRMAILYDFRIKGYQYPPEAPLDPIWQDFKGLQEL